MIVPKAIETKLLSVCRQMQGYGMVQYEAKAENNGIQQ